jgi:hypothetical protein
MQQIGNRMYSELVDFMAASLYAVVETTDSLEANKASDLKHYFNWFYNYMKENDGSKHFGDCTNHAIACHQCIIDEQRDIAATMINKAVFDQYLIDEELCVESGI